MSDLMQITQSQSKEITTAVEHSMETLDSILLPMQPVEKATYLRDNLRGLESLNIKVSQAILFHMWKVVSEQLWTIPLENGIQYDSFRDWVDDQVAPTFNKRGDDRPPAEVWFQDAVRICERTLPYAMTHPVKDKKGELITPKYLIKNVGLGKLKITSSKFTDESELTPAQRNELLFDLSHMPSSQIRAKYTSSRFPKINAAINIMPTGNVDLLLMGLNDRQIEMIRYVIGESNLNEYMAHIRPEDRQALLGILPEDSRSQPVEPVREQQQDVA